jgi:dipeptidyl aminopeptidase/acylaminoacyl peptidase
MSSKIKSGFNSAAFCTASNPSATSAMTRKSRLSPSVEQMNRRKTRKSSHENARNGPYQHFGDRAYSDVDSATDFAVAQGWADPNRQTIFGWSAGGFMTSWTVTQTHRYKAAIEGAGITDWLSFIPTSDISQVDYDMRLQEKSAEPFLVFSAVMYADQVTTPLLILHGESDLRVPSFQGREFFVLLAERGKTVRMVTYPGSPHFPRLAEQRRDIFTEVKAWLDKYNP